MKRFYRDVASALEGDSFAVRLDGRPIRTPARAALWLPTRALAQAVVAEWDRQGDEIDPRSMPITGLANAAIDQIVPVARRFAAGVAAYGETDLLCYRAESPAELTARQAAAWDPLLAWASDHYGVAFRTTVGVVHVAQPPETLARLGEAVAALHPFRLAALSNLVTLAGSLVIGLAVVEDAIEPGDAWDAASIDERWQAEQWGEDEEASLRAEARRVDFLIAAEFAALS